jgi:S-DNA-T family DNA segregation ATPase FtsK/SpoIIIE
MMELIIRFESREYEVCLGGVDPTRPMHEVAARWLGEPVDCIVVDGRTIPEGATVGDSALTSGSIVAIGGSAGRRYDAILATGPGRGRFNRPPRPPQPREPVPLHPPPAPLPPARALRFGWAALVVPLVVGLAMALLVSPRMAVFAVFSPAMLLANWVEEKRRARRERRAAGRDDRVALHRFEAQVAAAHADAVAGARRAATGPEAIIDRALTAGSRLWERRPEHDDFMRLGIGTACARWKPLLRSDADLRPEVAAILDRELHDVPVLVSLEPGRVVGVAGARRSVLGIARGLVLATTVEHGPADVAISILTDSPFDWDWAKWLPHVLVDGSGRRRLAATEPEIASVAGLLPDGDAPGAPRRHHLLVVDLPELGGGARARVRDALRAGRARGVAGLAIASRKTDLPSSATTIVEVGDATTAVHYPDGAVTQVRPWLVGAAQARRAARALARIDDPEATFDGAGIPEAVALLSLLGMGRDLEQEIEARWRGTEPGLAVPIGATAAGPLTLDLVADGPHSLLGGTTGAGKSELLRTLVAALAATTSPDDLNFVLIDYKGGSAFDACASLPHTVGVVTDLDGHLAQRALTCLDAELRHREQRLRHAGVTDVAAFVREDDDVPLPRLVVVIDEFATLAKELPDFIDALVGIAQRGRSLGVHLVLATQRPSGVVSDNIKANTNLRIALRMQDGADSSDVIGSGAAARIGRNQPGRGLARLGPGDVVAFQAALVTGRSRDGDAGLGRLQPFRFGSEQPMSTLPVATTDRPSDLERIVVACRACSGKMAVSRPRQPWPAPLPAAIHLHELPDAEAGTTAFALADEPHRQRQVAAVWSAAAGNLLLYGLPGSGTSTALATLAVALGRSHSPDRVHLYVLDFDDQRLGPLGRLPHVGAVIGPDDRERQLRLLRRLGRELRERRLAAANPQRADSLPIIVTFIDNYAGFAAAFDEPGDGSVRSLLGRLVADGPGVGMYTILTAKQPGEVPLQLAAVVASKLAFRLADRYDYSGLGVPATDPPLVPGRAFEAITGRELQVALPDPGGLAVAVRRVAAPPVTVAPWTIQVLPVEVNMSSVGQAAEIGSDRWFLPIGIADSDLGPAGLELHDGEHALITGPARSGKSTALATIAAVARAAAPRLRIGAVMPRRSPLGDSPALDAALLPGELAGFVASGTSHLILVDDAELLDEAPYLNDLLRSRDSGTRLVAAGAPEVIRTLYGHWTQEVRRSRIGCALRPNVAADGDLWQTPLPRRGPAAFPAGRGYLLADGKAELVQLGRK